MKITHNKVGRNLDLNDTGKSDKAGKSDKVGAEKAGANGKASVISAEDLGATKVSVSSRAQDMKKATEIAKAAPDVDEAKVAKLQKMIDEGKYKVSAKDLADKMVDEQLGWE